MIVDTGPLVAAANESDPQCGACQSLFRGAGGSLLIPALVVAEAAYLVERDLGSRAEANLVRSLAHSRYEVVGPGGEDLRRMAALIEQYADLSLGATDASIIALAEARGITDVATLDRRHFSVVRPRHVDALTLLP